ncbi:MAG: hypothetical protein Q7U35_04535 [Methanobacteriaceae archaeon]|nr:hypothetical protein [Methanobacteriaceae archaeon]
MVNEIYRIYDYIDKLEDCDHDMKRFLKGAVQIEFIKQKEGGQYTNKYKDLLNSILGNTMG